MAVLDRQGRNSEAGGATPSPRTIRRNKPVGPHYKWIALTNTTLGALMATIDASIVLIALPCHLQGHRHQPAGTGRDRLFPLAAAGLHGGHDHVARHLRPHLRHVWPRSPL